MNRMNADFLSFAPFYILNPARVIRESANFLCEKRKSLSWNMRLHFLAEQYPLDLCSSVVNSICTAEKLKICKK